MEKSISLTKGPIYKRILLFTLPIILSNVFQQLYSIVDSLVVGNFVGKSALAAISSTNALIFLLVGFFMGTFSGVGVVISKYYGASNSEKVVKSVATAVVIAIVSSVILTIFGVFLSPKILIIMQTPSDVIADATIYLQVYFLGISAIIMYNCANGILQAVGNSTLPLIFLIISSLLNICLDILFVYFLKFGLIGAAVATDLSQFFCAILAFYHLVHVKDVYRVDFKKLHVDSFILSEMLKYGIPAGIQNSVISIGNVSVQTNINKFGSSAMAGAGIYSRITGMAFIPVTSFSLSLTTFISQNLGAHEYTRAKKGALFSVITTMIMAQFLGILINLNATNLVQLFNSDPEVISVGVLQIKVITLSFFLVAFSHCAAGILRGSGRSVVPMYVMLGFWCVFRVIYCNLITYLFFDIKFVFFAYPISWILSSIVFLFYLLKKDWVYGLERR